MDLYMLLFVSLLKQEKWLVSLLMNSIIQSCINLSPAAGTNSFLLWEYAGFKAEVILQVTDTQHLKQCWNSKSLTSVGIDNFESSAKLEAISLQISCYICYKASQEMDSRIGHSTVEKKEKKQNHFLPYFRGSNRSEFI